MRDHMLSKWIIALQIWLDQMSEMSVDDQNDTFDEIEQWYKGWKSFIPEELRED